jgi:membrane protein Man1
MVLAYWRYRKNTEREVFNLVSEIISMLELHHQSFATTSPGGTQESYLAINHIRDNLIQPKNRKNLAGLWEKAVKFLDENESR